MTADPIPPGFVPISRTGPFLDLFGPVYTKDEGSSTIVAVRVGDKHLNTLGIAHGGMLVTLADSALGINLSRALDVPRPMVTVNLSTDFLQPARRGDWLEAHVQVQRVGVHLAFASCHLKVGDRLILRASGVFAIIGPEVPLPAREDFDG